MTVIARINYSHNSRTTCILWQISFLRHWQVLFSWQSTLRIIKGSIEMCEHQKLIPELRLDSLMCWALVVISSSWGLLEWKPVYGIEAIIIWIPFFLQYFNHGRCSKKCYKPIPGSFDSACETKVVWIPFVFCKFAIEPQSVDVVSSRWI